MKKSITIWALKGGTTGEISMLEAAKKVKEAGFDAIEASLWEHGAISLESDYASIQALRNALQRNQLTISSISTLLLNEVSLIAEDVAERNRAFEVCSKMIALAAELNVPTVSFSPGRILKDVSYRDCCQRSIEQVRKLSQMAEKENITLCVENVWQGLLLSPMEMAMYCDDVGSSNVAACLDIGNASISTYAQHWVTELNQRIGKVHITDLKVRRGIIYEFVDPSKGDADWERVMRELTKVGYDDYVTIEAFEKRGFDDTARLKELSECFDKIVEKKA